MPRSKKIKHYDDNGKQICGAKVKGGTRKGQKCRRSPMKNGKCRLHGGLSTGPRNSAAFYLKQIIDVPGGTRLKDALNLENPLDLSGEIGLVRKLLSEMDQDPLMVYCTTCRRYVEVVASCPHEEEMNEQRINDGKNAVTHNVYPKNQDTAKMVQATKHLSEIVKNHKEIQKGKEIHIRIEVLNLLVAKVIQAYEEADRLAKPEDRREIFVGRLEQLLLSQSATGALANEHLTSAKR